MLCYGMFCILLGIMSSTVHTRKATNISLSLFRSVYECFVRTGYILYTRYSSYTISSKVSNRKKKKKHTHTYENTCINQRIILRD